MEYLPEKYNGFDVVIGRPDKEVIHGGSAEGMKRIYTDQPEPKRVLLHIGTCKVNDPDSPTSLGRLMWKREPLGWLIDYGDFYGCHDVYNGEVSPSLTRLSEKYSHLE